MVRVSAVFWHSKRPGLGLIPSYANRIRCWLLIGLLIVQHVHGTTEEEVVNICPNGWINHENSCYFFMSQRSSSWQEALNICNVSMSANLVSINSMNEDGFIAEWLDRNDLRRKGWWTSGYMVNDRWEWAGDGTKISFYPKRAHLENKTRMKIAYVWRNDAFEWAATSEHTQLAFICELPKSKILSYYNDIPGPDYGLIGADSISYSHGPKMILEPSDQITYANGPRHSVELSCKAKSYPAPTYRWTKAATGQQIMPNESNYVIIDGTLIIRNVTGKDFGSYFCEVSNGRAMARSRSVFFSSSYVKEFPKSRLDVYGFEGSGKSIPCQAPAHFPQSLSFAWMHDMVKNFLHESNRIFISGDGTLHFSYLTRNDEKKYACSIVIPELHTGYYGPFFALKVDPPVQVPVALSVSKPTIPDDFLHIYPVEPQLGSSAWIECFAYGKPAPTYRWIRVDRPLSAAASIRNFGRRLYFPSLRMNDTGTYRCVAENQFGTTAREINLVLQISPKLVTPLADVVVETGGKASFVCDVFGVPKADYEWFHNGKPLNPLLMLEEDQGRILIEGNKLHVENVQESDSGIYQCHAMNSIGQIGSSAELIIRNFAPTFAKQFFHQIIYVAAGNTARLPCRAEALPVRRRTTWKHDNSLISDKTGTSIALNDDLTIENITFSHAGRYTCIVENSLGIDSISMILSVLPPLTVSIHSKSMNDSILLECLTNIASNKYIDTAYRWTFNCHDLNLLEQFQSNYSDINQDTILIKKGTFEGVVMCRVDTIAGHASATIRIESLRVPMIPIKVLAENVSVDGIYLSWELPKAKQSMQENDLVVFNVEACLFGFENCKYLQTIRPNRDIAEGYLINGPLLPYSLYQFRVSAQNRIGTSSPSQRSNFIRILPGAPIKAVKNLRATVLVSGETLVQWKPLQKSEWASEQVGYLVEWRFTNSSISGILKSSVVINQTDADHYVIQAENTKFCSSYEIQVYAFNEHGKGPPIGKSIEPRVVSASFSQISNVTVTVINASAVWVRWNVNNIGDQPCQKWIGIKLLYWPVQKNPTDHSSSKSFPFLKFAHFNQTEIIVGQLVPNTMYAFELTPFNINGDEPRSVQVTAITNKRAPRLSPSAVSVNDDVNDGRVSAIVRWSEVVEQDTMVSGYKLHLFQSPWTIPYVVKIELKNVADWQPVAEMNGLRSFQEYKLCINAFNEGGDGPLSSPIFFYLGSHSLGWSLSGACKCYLCISCQLLILCWSHLRGS